MDRILFYKGRVTCWDRLAHRFVFLVSLNLFLQTVIFVYFYMFIYNLTLIGIGWILQSTHCLRIKTLHSFGAFSFEGFYLFSLTIFLFSLAGVPPFMGFFNKLYLMSFLVNNSFFLFYSILVVLLLIGLYFYMQNLRFLHSTNYKRVQKPFLLNLRLSIGLCYYLIVLVFILLFGFKFIDDFVIYYTWLLH